MLEAAGLDVNPPRASVPIPVEDADGYIPLEGLIDLDAELERLKKKTEELRKRVAAAEKKLNNPNFVEKAPEDVVNNERSRKTSLQEQLANVEHIIDHLS